LLAYQKSKGGASRLSEEANTGVPISCGINIVRQDKAGIRVFATLNWQRTGKGKFDSVRIRDAHGSEGFAQLVLVFAAKLTLPHTHTKACNARCSLMHEEVQQDLVLVRKYESEIGAFSISGMRRTLTHLRWPKDGGYSVIPVADIVGRCYVVQNYKLAGDNFLLNQCTFVDD
jgi:hypothetical protein